MAAGLQANSTLNDVNNMVGNSAAALNAALLRIHELDLWYAALPVGKLTNAPWAMASADDATVGSALADGEQLYQLFHNNGTLGTAKDFATFLKQVWGYGV